MPSEIINLQIDMAKLQQDVSYTKEKVRGINDNLNAFIEKADNCYARKDKVDKLERFVSRVMWTAIIALFGFVFTIFREVILDKLLN
jgi:hypothetical protein